MRKYLRQIDWLALSTSALILVVGLWVVSVLPPDGRKPNAYEAAEEQSQNLTLAERTEIKVANYSFWLTAFTAILAFSTIGLWIATWRSGERQSEETRILQRAYLSVVPGGIRPFEASDDDRIACDIVIRNAGNLPARNVSWFIDKKYGDNPREADFLVDESQLVGDIVIGPRCAIRKGAKPTDTPSLKTKF